MNHKKAKKKRSIVAFGTVLLKDFELILFSECHFPNPDLVIGLTPPPTFTLSLLTVTSSGQGSRFACWVNDHGLSRRGSRFAWVCITEVERKPQHRLAQAT
ncbi:hypothetical protein NL676_012989 [Syzygium grande]|nr:hypothetical protein NL676_012989 [Syzygium grande]